MNRSDIDPATLEAIRSYAAEVAERGPEWADLDEETRRVLRKHFAALATGVGRSS